MKYVLYISFHDSYIHILLYNKLLANTFSLLLSITNFYRRTLYLSKRIIQGLPQKAKHLTKNKSCSNFYLKHNERYLKIENSRKISLLL